MDIILFLDLSKYPHHTGISTKNASQPHQSLPTVVEENVQILIYDYQSYLPLPANLLGSFKFDELVENLISELHGDRSTRQVTRRPIIFIADSLGESIILTALNRLRKSSSIKTRTVLLSTYRVFSALVSLQNVQLEGKTVNIPRFDDADSPEFNSFAVALQRSVAEAPDIIRARWQEALKEPNTKSANAVSTTGLEPRNKTRRRPLNVDDTNDSLHWPSHAQLPESNLDTLSDDSPTTSVLGALRYVPNYIRHGDVELADWTPEINSSSNISGPSLSEIWAWYLSSGVGFATLVASLITALCLYGIAKKGLSTSFGVATWFLVAGTLLASTFKACLGERPHSRPPDRILH